MFNKNKSNGMNAMRAHQARAQDDNTFVRSIVESYTFLGFGTVMTYANERLTVVCGNRKFTNVEVMVFGVDGWGIKPVPAPNDRVMLFSTQVPVGDIKQFTASGSMPAYDPSGLKAIPITDSRTAQLITVSMAGIEVTGTNKVTINNAGIQVQDGNGNKVITSASGVAFQDANGNKVTADASGMVLEDKNQNNVTASSSGVAFQDANGNKYTTASSGVTIEDKNGCKIETSSSSVKINGKLEIKK